MQDDQNGQKMMVLKVRLHWRDFAHDFALACTFSKENK